MRIEAFERVSKDHLRFADIGEDLPALRTFLPSMRTSLEIASVRRMIERPGVDLPQPDFADKRESLAPAQFERNAFDGMMRPCRAHKFHDPFCQ